MTFRKWKKRHRVHRLRAVVTMSGVRIRHTWDCLECGSKYYEPIH